MLSAGRTTLPPVGVGVPADPFACFPAGVSPMAPAVPIPPAIPGPVSSPGFSAPQIFASDVTTVADQPVSIGGIGSGGGPNMPQVFADIQREMQEVSTDIFGLTNFSAKGDGALKTNCVVWCDGVGFLVNPTETSLHYLESAGINLSDTGHVILTESSEETAAGLVKLILRRERIKVIAPDGVFDSIAKRARSLLSDEYDIRRWVDHEALEAGGEIAISSPGESVAVVSLGKEGQFQVSFRDEKIGSELASQMEHLQSVRIIRRDLSGDPEALRQYLGHVSLFSHLDERDLREVIGGSEVVEFAPGDTVIRKGDGSDACYVILTGASDVVADGNETVWNFRSRDFFGDVGIQSGAPRSATVNARTRLTALKIGRELYNRVIFFPLRGKSKFNSDKYAIETFMKSLAPDILLSEASIEAIALRTVRQAYAGEVREGEIGDSAYILLDGEVEVARSDAPKPLATLGALDIFGEMALCNPSSRRMASVVAKEGSLPHVLKIDRGLFEFIMYRYPGVDREIRRTIINRRRENRVSQHSPHIVRIPEPLAAMHTIGRDPNDVYNRWRGFLRSFDIDFEAVDVSVPELSKYAQNVEILHGLIRQILGEACIRQRMIKRALFSKNGGAPDAHYEPKDGTLHISKSLLEKETIVFANGILIALGEIAAEHLHRSELLAEEIAELENSAGVLRTMKDALPGIPRPAGSKDVIASFLPLYVTDGDRLRDAIHSIRTPVEVRHALKNVYEVLNRLFFSGIEFTRAKSGAALASFRGEKPRRGLAALRGRDDVSESSSAFDAGVAAEDIGEAINSVFRRYSWYDNSGFYRKIYEPEIFSGRKLEFMRLLSKKFQDFHIQKFTDQIIEVSIYDPASLTRAVVQFSRVKKGALFRWKVCEGFPKVAHGNPPVSVTLVNLESRQFGGVKGTPENILTVGAYLERHRARESTVAIYDCQWPENSVAALVEEIRLSPPDVLGVSATFGTIAELDELLRNLAHLDERPLVVVGGLISTWSYEYLLEKYPSLICARYEGEEAMAKIVDMVARMPVDDRREFIAHNVAEMSAIPNIAFWHEGEVRAHRREYVDLRNVPAPDRRTEVHRQKPAKWLMNAEGQGRGCDYSACYFCTRTHGKFRFFPIERGLEDFGAYMEADVPFVVYVDEDFLPEGRMEAAEEFARGIIELKERHRAAYVAKHGREPTLPSFYMAVRAPGIYKEGDEEGNARRLDNLKLLKKAGLVKIFLGAESGSAVQFHKTYHKGGAIPEVEKAIGIIRGEGIQVVAGFITFDPALTLEQLSENMDFMERNGLVFVDPLTEPLNPFKYFRAQAGSLLAKRLRDIGLLSSSMDPNLLSHDSAYRNPAIRLITAGGDVWKSSTAELDYHLKGILWFAEQSEAEMEKARRFVDLFNRLKQADFALIKEMSGEIGDPGRGTRDATPSLVASRSRKATWSPRDFTSSLAKTDDGGQTTDDGGQKNRGTREERGIERFLDVLDGLPAEKALFELKRALFPHADIFRQLSDYITARAKDADFDWGVFLSEFLNGAFPEDFNFGPSSAEEYRAWLGAIRADIAHNMLSPAELSALTERVERLLRANLERRLGLLREFSSSDWREFYKAHPEAVKRGKLFEETLAGAIKGHEEIIAKSDANFPSPLAGEGQGEGEIFSHGHPPSISLPSREGGSIAAHLANRPYKINWRTSLDEYLSYRHPDMGEAIGRVIDVLIRLDADGTLCPSTIADIHIYEDGRISARGGSQRGDPAMIANCAIAKLFVNVLDPFESPPEVMREFRAVFEKSARNGYASVEEAIGDLEDLRRLSARPIVITVDGAEYKITPGRIEVGNVSQAQKIWRAVLAEKNGLDEQKKFAIINSLAETLLGQETIGAEWMEALAIDIDVNIAPATVYLPDTEEYRGWKTPGERVVFLHPRIYDIVWPGIAPHLNKLKLLAHPEMLDSFERTLEMIRSGELSPEFAQFVYEVFFNKLSLKAFLRNDEPDHIVRNYTSLSGRVMPKRTPVLLLDRNDPRVKFYEPKTADARRALEAENGKVRFVVHPQVYEKWKREGRLPYEGMETEWALVFPTSSARTLYVLDERGDYIAKTHSTIWVGPAVRRLTEGNVEHSHRVSRQISAAIDAGELPPVFKDRFAFIDDSGGVVIDDPAFYPEKRSVGVIARSAAAYPRAEGARVLIPGFALHNNAVTVDGNASPETLIQIIGLNTKGSGESPISYFSNEILRPLYRMFLYFVFKQGILFEPHGQNFFVEVDMGGRITRLVFKDWQSTMVDLETRIRRGLPGGGIAKHLLDREAGAPLSLSLVFDYYFGAYFFKHMLDTLARAYHGASSVTSFRAGLIARFKEIFEEEVRIYKERGDEFPDALVRHGKKPLHDTSNDVPYMISGPPAYRMTSFERAIRTAVDERRVRGVIDVPVRGVDAEYAGTRRIDLERTRLYVKSGGAWEDARTLKPGTSEIVGSYQIILPKEFDPQKTYPLLVFLHGYGSDGSEVTTWADKLGRDDAIVCVPMAPFTTKEYGRAWFNDDLSLDQKEASMDRIEEIVNVLRTDLKAGKTILGGLSQGGYMAMHLFAHRPRVFDAVFAINAPFSPEYLGGLPVEAGRGRAVKILQLESDQIVPAQHALRAEKFFRERGFDVELLMHGAGQHNKLSPSMTGDINQFLDEQLGAEEDEGVVSLQDLGRILGSGLQEDEARSSASRMIESIGRRRIAGREIALYEALLDKNLPFAIRCACLTALEELNFKPIFDVWEDTTLLAGFREAGLQIKTLERMLFDLASHIAFIGKESMPPEALKKFAVIVSSIESLGFQHRQMSAKNEAEAGQGEIKALVDTIECVYDMAMELKGEVVGKMI